MERVAKEPGSRTASLSQSGNFQRCAIGVVILARACGKITFTTAVLFVPTRVQAQMISIS